MLFLHQRTNVSTRKAGCRQSPARKITEAVPGVSNTDWSELQLYKALLLISLPSQKHYSETQSLNKFQCKLILLLTGKKEKENKRLLKHNQLKRNNLSSENTLSGIEDNWEQYFLGRTKPEQVFISCDVCCMAKALGAKNQKKKP